MDCERCGLTLYRIDSKEPWRHVLTAEMACPEPAQPPAPRQSRLETKCMDPDGGFCTWPNCDCPPKKSPVPTPSGFDPGLCQDCGKAVDTVDADYCDNCVRFHAWWNNRILRGEDGFTDTITLADVRAAWEAALAAQPPDPVRRLVAKWRDDYAHQFTKGSQPRVDWERAADELESALGAQPSAPTLTNEERAAIHLASVWSKDQVIATVLRALLARTETR